MTSTISDLARAWDEWHAAREQDLREPHGWLSLTALHWLTAEPAAFPGIPGRWSATPEGVVLTVSAADDVVIETVREARRIDGTVTLHPVDGMAGTMVEIGERVVEVVRRTDSHALRVRDPQAPTLTAFTGVPAFPVDERWVVPARFEPYPEPKQITVGAVVDGLTHRPTAVGVVRFALAGQAQELVALKGRNGELYIHFRDATSGVTTYPGGRALSAKGPAQDGTVELDFNRAVNLPCAFTDHATCPLPPRENVLTAAVEAGEKLPA